MGDPMRFVAGHQNRGKIEGRYEVDQESGCWLWLGRKDRQGYAKMRLDRKTVGVYRLTYERKYGPIPAGLEPHHRCDNPSCVNPDHIEPLTHAENIRRSRMRKLDWEKVDEIRSSPEPGVALARRFGVSDAVVSLIRQGKMWPERTRG